MLQVEIGPLISGSATAGSCLSFHQMSTGMNLALVAHYLSEMGSSPLNPWLAALLVCRS